VFINCFAEEPVAAVGWERHAVLRCQADEQLNNSIRQTPAGHV
jgi:hypothetical protein